MLKDDNHTSDACAWPRYLRLSWLMGAIAFCAVDFWLVGRLIASSDSDAVANVVAAIAVTIYLFVAYKRMTGPENEYDRLVAATTLRARQRSQRLQ
jgi:hypothetical protein